MKPIRVRIIECALESGKKGPEAWVKVQIVSDGDEFTLPIAVEDAAPILEIWKDPGPMADLTLTLRKR